MNSRRTTAHCTGPTGIVLVLLCGWLAWLPSTSEAAIYFVDANHPYARDSNPGVEALPFKTINKATSLVNAGDTVFIKAGVYREMVILSRSGTSTTSTGRTGPVTIASPITFAVYPGHEGKAIISAAELVTNWRKCTGPADCAGNPNWEHIYWADVAALVKAHPDSSFAVRQVFQHGKLLKRSRYPDTGWSYPTSMPDPMKRFTDDTLSQPNGYFTGAVCHIKTANWRINQIPITSFSGSTITLSKSPWFAITTRYGYYITSVVGEINAEGEWAYDAMQKRIYLWPQGDIPEGVEFSYRQHCIRSYGGTAWNVVRGLTLRYPCTHGVWLYRSSNMTIEDSTIEHAFSCGIYLIATGSGESDNNQILRNTIRYCCEYGIYVDSLSSNTNIEDNYVYATGTDTFAGDLMNGRGEGICVGGPYTRIYHNRVDKTGFIALYMAKKALSRETSYNHVTNAGLALADGGGIYLSGYSDAPEENDHIHHNIFADSLGCLSMDRSYDTGRAPTPSTHSGIFHGIYVDEAGNHNLIEHNTVMNCRTHGITFHWAPENVVQKNTVYGNRETQVCFSGDNRDGRRLVNDVLLDNILFSTAPQQYTLWVGMNYDGVRFGQSDRNYFYNPYKDSHIFVSWLDPSTNIRTTEDLTLYEWCQLSRYDANSRDFSYLEQRNDLTLASPRASRIVYNTTLEPLTVDLAGKQYCEVQGKKVSGKVTLPPFESKILIALDPNGPAPAAP